MIVGNVLGGRLFGNQPGSSANVTLHAFLTQRHRSRFIRALWWLSGVRGIFYCMHSSVLHHSATVPRVDKKRGFGASSEGTVLAARYSLLRQFSTCLRYWAMKTCFSYGEDVVPCFNGAIGIGIRVDISTFDFKCPRGHQ